MHPLLSGSDYSLCSIAWRLCPASTVPGFVSVTVKCLDVAVLGDTKIPFGAVQGEHVVLSSSNWGP